MPIRRELRNILTIIADLAHNNANSSVFDTAVSKRSGLPPYEVYNYLNELDSLGLIKLQVRARGADVRLLNITKEGSIELSDKDLK